MSETIHVIPEKGLKVRMPDKPNEFLPAKGKSVPKNSYWLRRIQDGSVTDTEAKGSKTKTNQQES